MLLSFCLIFYQFQLGVAYKSVAYKIKRVLLRFYRSSHLRFSVKKGVLKNFTNFTEKHLCWSLFFNKKENFIKKETLTQLFSCKFFKIFKKFLKFLNFLQNTFGLLILPRLKSRTAH